MRQIQILLVEDHKQLQELYTFLLVREGIQVEAVEDGEQAFNRLQTQRYDLLITDLALPGMDGLELIRRVRSDAGLAPLPIIALTAFGQRYKTLAEQAGATVALIKPVENNELLNVMDELLNAASSTPASVVAD